MEVGFVGLGLMGLPMAQRLFDAGESLVVYNRTAAKTEPLQELGVAIAPSPEILVDASDVLLLMLTDATAIRELLLAERPRQALGGRTVIQMGTIAPTESRAIAKEVIAAGAQYLEAPVLGSIPEAKEGKLIVMVGATPAQFNHYWDLLSNFGSDPMLLGEVGTASAVKLALNQLIGSLTTAFALSLGFVQRYDVDPEAFMTILRGSALYASTFDKKLQRMVERNYDRPNFPTKHLLKDINLFLQEATATGLETASVEGVREVLLRTAERLGDADYSALFSTVSPE